MPESALRYNLPEGQIAEEIVAAYNVVFCFGFTLQGPEQLATRPRSIGVCQSGDRITLSFVEAPMPVANALMEQWARSLLRKKAPAPTWPSQDRRSPCQSRPGRKPHPSLPKAPRSPRRRPATGRPPESVDRPPTSPAHRFGRSAYRRDP